MDSLKYICFILAFFTTTQAEQTGVYSCLETTATDMYTMTFYLKLNGDPITRIYGGDNAGVETPGCSSDNTIYTDPSGVYDYVLALSVSFGGPGFQSSVNCGGTEGLPKVVTWYVYTAQYDIGGWRSSYDTKFTLTCDFNSPTPLGVLFEATLNSGDFNQNLLTQTIEQVALAVFDETGTIDIGANSANVPIVLGTPVRLSITLTRNNIATGVAAFDGEAAGDSSFTNSIQLLDVSGCPFSTQSLITRFTAAGNQDTNKFQLLTESFPIAAIPGSTALLFRFSIHYCYDTPTDACTNYCTFNGGTTGRKRRAAPSGNETVGTNIKISFNSGAQKSLAPRQDANGAECYQSIGFIVALSMLGILFLVVVGFGFFACRTLMNKNRKESMSELHMANPNFK